MISFKSAFTAIFCLAATALHAAPPEIRTPTPVIYLADNLDEEQNLGWCIDTLGRGYAEELQVHSCKPQGGDVQFTFRADTGQIQSVAFPEKCMTVVDADAEKIPFRLRDCDADAAEQIFAYNRETKHILITSDSALCLAAGAESRKAGPFMSRDLVRGNCADGAAALIEWVVLP